MPGRAADMSIHAALAMQKALAQIEAASKLISNRETVVKDICNPGPKPVKAGGELTQTDLKRLQSTHLSSTSQDALVWIQAATFFSGRIQKSDDEMPGRAADMSIHAALAMQKVLAQIEAASKLISNRETVVKDICNPGSKPINQGGELSQTDLKRLG